MSLNPNMPSGERKPSLGAVKVVGGVHGRPDKVEVKSKLEIEGTA